MANMRTTVVLKTDIVDSTPRAARLTQSEIVLDRKRHKRFISDIATRYQGSIFQEEGDAYWIEFPSVTIAALAAIEMHKNLRSREAGKSNKQRLAIRIVITVGDILHLEQDTIGTVMSLTARIEKVTPSDEIYLSQAAWLILNKAEIQTTFVKEFNLKGFREPEKVYRIDQLHATRVFTDQYIVFTDLSNWSAYIKSQRVEKIESFLLEYDDLLNGICEEYEGVIRNPAGDNYFLTFSNVNQTLMAMEKLSQYWSGFIERHKVGLRVGIHKGKISIFRTYIYSEDIQTTALLTSIVKIMRPYSLDFAVLTTKRIYDEIKQTEWKKKFQKWDTATLINLTDNIKYRYNIKKYGVYHFTTANN